jgi:methionine synthase II (cobalamin-independent)
VGIMKNQFFNGREMDIFRVRFDSKTKVGSIQFNEKNLRSEAELMAALKDSVKDLDDGMYSVHPNDGLFARFEIINHAIPKLEKLSEHTGAIMPCWNNFEK